MADNTKILADAIADAKTLRAVALANAKKSLEESFGPKMKSALDEKLAELEESEDLDENEIDDVEDVAEDYQLPGDVGRDTDMPGDLNNQSGDANDLNKQGNMSNLEEELEGILRELGMEDESGEMYESDDLEENEENMQEKKDEESKPKKKSEKPKPSPKSKAPESPEMDDMGDEEAPAEDVAELSVAELTDIITNAVQQAVSGGGAPTDGGDMGMDSEMGDEGGMGDEAGEGDDMGALGANHNQGDEDVDLDELLAELSGDDLNESDELEEGEDLEESEDLDESEDLEEGEELDEEKAYYKASTKGKVGKPFNQGKKGFVTGPGQDGQRGAKTPKMEGKNWYDASTKGSIKGGPKTTKNAKVASKTSKISEMVKAAAQESKDLKEAMRTIHVLKETLKETNLLNAKLLYVNKLFKAKPLTESQKVKVIAAFDKAFNKEEAKLIYESLNETLTAKRSPLKEAVMGSSSSKSVGSGKPKGNLIVEDATVARFKKLAGII